MLLQAVNLKTYKKKIVVKKKKISFLMPKSKHPNMYI